MQIRSLVSADYEVISPVVDEWWGGRPVRHLVHRLFFEHFSSTSFALAEDGELCAFLIGLRSQSQPNVAYIHFVGVAPSRRGKGLGRRLYSAFFERVSALGCTEVHCITSPVNAGSIAFHQSMGFSLVHTGSEQNGIPVSLNHAGEGQHRVLFRKQLAAAMRKGASLLQPLMILVAGPYRSGTKDDPALIAKNVASMTEASLQLFRAGHLPVMGEWYALPLIEHAGSSGIGDAVFNEIFHPISRRLVAKCDACLRIGGPSVGADEMVSLARLHGKAVYYSLEEVPKAS